MGPMNAARSFAQLLASAAFWSAPPRCRLNCTDRWRSRVADGALTERFCWVWRPPSPTPWIPAMVEPTLKRIRAEGCIRLLGRREIAFDEPLNLLFVDQVLRGPLQRHALHRARCRARGVGTARCFPAPAAASSSRPEPRPCSERRAQSRRTSDSGARLLELGRREGLEIRRVDAGSRARGTARPPEDPRTADGVLEGDAACGAVSSRRGCSCPACSACGGAPSCCTGN